MFLTVSNSHSVFETTLVTPVAQPLAHRRSRAHTEWNGKKQREPALMPTNFEDTGRKVDATLRDAAERIELEIQKAIRYLNDEVVPQVRVHGSRGLREASDQLRKLAEHLDEHRSQQK